MNASRTVVLCCLLVAMTTGRGAPAYADDMEDVARMLLGARCGKHGIVKKLPPEPGGLPSFRCDCDTMKEECPQTNLIAVPGHFTSPDAQELLLVVEDMREYCHADGWGYTVLMRKVKSDWKTVGRGAAITQADHLVTVRSSAGTDILLSYWSDCWQGCCLGDYLAQTLKLSGNDLTFVNAGISVRFVDSAPKAGETYLTRELEKVIVADTNGDGLLDVTLSVREESGTQDGVGKQKPSKRRTFEMRFILDGKTFSPVPGTPKFMDEEC